VSKQTENRRLFPRGATLQVESSLTHHVLAALSHAARLLGEEQVLAIRLLILHVLPDSFVRIRYYGLLANRHREKALALCRQVLPGPPARKIPKTD
jgi:hypothetical protein